MKRLVNIFLRGAADGLNLLAPVDDPAYHQARPTLGLRKDQVIDVGINGFGLHPAASHLAKMIQAGTVAVIPAAGYSGQTRSHFQSQAILESAVEENGTAVTARAEGWLGRMLEADSKGPLAPFRGVAVGTVSLPPSLWGTQNAVGCPDLGSLRLGVLDTPAKPTRGSYRVIDSPLRAHPASIIDDWHDSNGAPTSASLGVDAAANVLSTISSLKSGVADRSATDAVAPDPSAARNEPASDSGDSQLFSAASGILESTLGTEVIQIDIGGWDTHKDQGSTEGRFADLLAGLDAGLKMLMDQHAHEGNGLVITVMTEFGRRVRENASGGTDHGRGGLALVLGDGVAGGMKGSWPGLVDLDQGDLKAVNDLRVLQSEVLSHVFGAAPTARTANSLGLFG